MEEVKTLTENISIIWDKLTTINEYAKTYNLLAYIDNFDLLYSKHEEDAERLKTEILDAIKNNRYWTYEDLNLKAKTMK